MYLTTKLKKLFNSLFCDIYSPRKSQSSLKTAQINSVLPLLLYKWKYAKYNMIIDGDFVFKKEVVITLHELFLVRDVFV
jgi:hypothetical protein